MSSDNHPTVYVVGGVNGAGKSTGTAGLLREKDLENFIIPI